MKLSILIPTVVGREHLLERLRSVLNPQLTEDVEVIEQKDNKEISIGRKRQTLLEKAAGEYRIEFNPASSIKNPASSVYFYRLQAGNYSETKKMILMK